MQRMIQQFVIFTKRGRVERQNGNVFFYYYFLKFSVSCEGRWQETTHRMTKKCKLVKREVLAVDRIRLAEIVFTLWAKKQHCTASHLILSGERTTLKM